MNEIKNIMQHINVKLEDMEDITQECLQSYISTFKDDVKSLPGFLDYNYDSLMESILEEVISPIDEHAVNSKDIFKVNSNDELEKLVNDEVKYGKLKIYKVNKDLDYLSYDELINNNVVTQVVMDFDSTYNNYLIYGEQ